MIQTVISIVCAVLALGILVMAHELGHFITAKRGGVQVNEFWIGMGPAIWKKEWHGTLYCLRILPFGGACVMEGEDGESESEHAFSKASLPRRMLIVAAGALVNFLFGFLIVLSVLAAQQGDFITTTIESFEPGFAYEGETMLMQGDTILSINGHRIFERQDISAELSDGAGRPYDFVVRRNGARVKIQDLPLTAEFTDANGNALFGLSFAAEPKTVWSCLRHSVTTSIYYARVVWRSLGMLITGKVGVNQLSGPIVVSEVMAQTLQQDFIQFLGLVAFVSINLGVMNLLPLPALDGGRLLFLIIEAIRRKPVPPKFEGYVHAAGMALLLLLMVYVTGQDIWRTFFSGWG